MSQDSQEFKIPKLIKHKETEKVIDARICKISKCKFFQESNLGGQKIYNCKAGVYQARLPKKELDEVVKQNPSPIAGHKEDKNPYILRLLMSPDCVRKECGVTEIKYYNKVLDIKSENNQPLFKNNLKDNNQPNNHKSK